MKSSTYNNFTDDDRPRLEVFRLAGPALRELMLQTYVAFLKNIEDEEIKGSCRRLLRAMRKEYLSDC